ncbi:MAG: helix-turn-helix domain-containing protein [Anaerolineales bacterium]|nr:helix-turn-helix domain-containing protein [Anaerolineales bacterium]
MDTALVKKARKQAVKAILVVGPKQPDIDTSTTADLPIMHMQTGEDLRAVEQKLMLALTSKQSAMLERERQIHEQLTNLAAGGIQVEELAYSLHEISRRGIIIHNKRLKITAEFPSADMQPIWSDITAQLSMLENLPVSLRDRKQAGQQSMVLHQDLSGGISRIIVPIIVGGVARGYLSVVGMEGTLDNLDQVVAIEGALISAVVMSRAKAIRETEKRLQSDLLTALLQEDLSPRDAGMWVEAMGLDQSGTHVALQFAWDSPSPPSRRRLETLINGEVIRMGIKISLNPTGEKVICFCQVTTEDRRPALALELAQKVFEQAKVEFPDIKLRCGVGTPATDLNNWRISFREAGQALEMACRLDETKPLYYPDLSVYRLLMLLEYNPELKNFLEDVLGPLFSHDVNSQFIETLEAYFEHKGNLSQTADALYIHRNTLSYRLERIADISGLNLNNPDIAFAVQLALRIHRMMKAKD